MTLNIKCATWDENILFLRTSKNLLITTARVFSQVLIHSNLFDDNLNKHGNLTDMTLSEMADKKYKKPFVCTVIEGICLMLCYMLSMYTYE